MRARSSAPEGTSEGYSIPLIHHPRSSRRISRIGNPPRIIPEFEVRRIR